MLIKRLKYDWDCLCLDRVPAHENISFWGNWHVAMPLADCNMSEAACRHPRRMPICWATVSVIVLSMLWLGSRAHASCEERSASVARPVRTVCTRPERGVC